MSNNLNRDDISAPTQWNNWEKFWQEWRIFVQTLFSPKILFFIVATVALFCLSLTVREDPKAPPYLTAIITVLLTISSVLLGRFISDRWSKLSDRGIMVTRGKSAIRGLNLLLQNLYTTEKRVKAHRGYLDQGNSDYKLIVMSYEEIVERCILLQEEAINAIEEWQDIIPEVEGLKTQIGVIRQLKDQQIELTDEITRLKEQPKSEKENEQLIKKLAEKEKELTGVKRKLLDYKSGINTALMGSTGLGIVVAREIDDHPMMEDLRLFPTGYSSAKKRR
ncbi:MAG: hypothetical protein M0T73_00015 [Deltaproteobacteria bacterium]|nr:hypothetical protein [Deltaproteobacteria bacterium]